jgi:predicted transcriptional regulator
MSARRRRERGQLKLLVLDALWKHGEGSAAQVHGWLGGASRAALTTVATVLQRLERAGEITHRLEGRQHVYSAVLTREEARASGVRQLLRQLFAGNPVSLVGQLLDSGDLTAEELAKMRRLIARRARQQER